MLVTDFLHWKSHQNIDSATKITIIPKFSAQNFQPENFPFWKWWFFLVDLKSLLCYVLLWWNGFSVGVWSSKLIVLEIKIKTLSGRTNLSFFSIVQYIFTKLIIGQHKNVTFEPFFDPLMFARPFTFVHVLKCIKSKFATLIHFSVPPK